MRLHELQRAFQERILLSRNAIESEFTNASDSDFDDRLGTYVGGYRSRLVEALSATYPVLKTTLGDREFDEEMCRFVESTPSHHYTIRYYGAEVAEHLRSRVGGELLAELATWEWTLADVFDASDDESLSIAALATVPAESWPVLRFATRACVRRVQTHSNIVEWWRAANGQCERPAALEPAPPAAWLLWRRGVTTQFRSLDAMEAALLDDVQNQATFGSLCERVTEFVDSDVAAVQAASTLKAWIMEELLAGYSIDERPRS